MVKVCKVVGELNLNVSKSHIVNINDYLYMIGNKEDYQPSDVIYKTTVDDVTNWKKYPINLPYKISESSLVKTQNRLYLIGGQRNLSSCSDNIFYSDILPDGNLTSWTLSDVKLPKKLSLMQAIIIKDKLHILGGYDTTIYGSMKAYTCDIDHKELIPNWKKKCLYQANENFNIVQIQDTLYVLGGHEFNSDINIPISTDIISYCNISSDGELTNFELYDIKLPLPISHGKLFKDNNKLYLIGGRNEDTILNTIFSCDISNGKINNFTCEGILPIPLFNCNISVDYNILYIFGGFTNHRKYNHNVYSFELN